MRTRLRQLDSRPKVCIVGAGFAGMSAAQRLSARHFNVTVIDPALYLEWLPNIHQLISGVQTAADLQLDRFAALGRLGHTFIQARVVALDRNSVQLDNGKTLSFDACLLCVGGVASNTLVPGASEHAIAARSISGCEEIAKRLRIAGLGPRPVQVAVVGAGIEGVEVLGEMLRKYAHYPQIRFALVDSSADILSGCGGNLDAEIRYQSRQLPVDFHLGAAVVAVEKGRLVLEGGVSLPCDLCVWSGGLQPNPLLDHCGLLKEPGGWVRIRDTLQSRQYQNLFVAGDASEMRKPIKKQAYHALDMGAFAAHNIERYLRGNRLHRFEPNPRPRLITFGDKATYLVFDDYAVSSTLFEPLKDLIARYGLLRMGPAGDPMGYFEAFWASRPRIGRVFSSFNPINVVKNLPGSRVIR